MNGKIFYKETNSQWLKRMKKNPKKNRKWLEIDQNQEKRIKNEFSDEVVKTYLVNGKEVKALVNKKNGAIKKVY